MNVRQSGLTSQNLAQLSQIFAGTVTFASQTLNLYDSKLCVLVIFSMKSMISIQLTSDVVNIIELVCNDHVYLQSTVNNGEKCVMCDVNFETKYVSTSAKIYMTRST